MTCAEIEALIARGLEAAPLRVWSEDGTHFQALVVSSAFTGKSTLARHRMVYAALGERLGREIHALSLRTFTPDEWRAAGQAIHKLNKA